MTDSPADNPPNSLPPASPAEGPAPVAPPVVKNKGGRPKAGDDFRTAKNIRTALREFAKGNTTAIVAALIGCSDRNLAQWMVDDPEFGAQCRLARAKAVAPIMPAMIRAAKGDKSKGEAGDFDAQKFIGDRHHMLNREYVTFKPDALTGEKVAAAISGINTILLQFVPSEKLQAAQAMILEHFKELLATDRRDGDDGS